MADEPEGDDAQAAFDRSLDRMVLRRRDVRIYSARTGERLTDQTFRLEPVEPPATDMDNFLADDGADDGA
jgi:hypothetical protein